MSSKELKEKLELWLSEEQADQIVTQSDMLTYPELKKRYAAFVESGKLWDTISKESVITNDLIEMLETLGKNRARHTFIVHALIMDILFDEEDKKTAVNFYMGVTGQDQDLIEDVIENHDRKGNYGRLYRKYGKELQNV